MNKLLTEIKGLRTKAQAPEDDNTIIMPSGLSDKKAKTRTFSLFSRKSSSVTPNSSSSTGSSKAFPNVNDFTSSTPKGSSADSITAMESQLKEAALLFSQNQVNSDSPASKDSPSSVQKKKTLKEKQKESLAAKRQYKQLISFCKDFAKVNTELSAKENDLGNLIGDFSEGTPEDFNTDSLIHIGTQFGQQLRRIGAIRQEMYAKFERSVEQVQALYNDYKKNATKTKNIDKEFDFQLAKRDVEYGECVRNMAMAYLEYFQGGYEIMKMIEPDLKKYGEKVMKPSRETFFSATNTGLSTIKHQIFSENQLFGVPLTTILQRKNEPGPIPVMIEKLVIALEKKAICVEGPFRVPGAVSDIKAIKKEIDEGNSVNFDDVNTHTLCGLFKQYFRDLPEPLLTYDRFDDFIEMSKTNDPQQKIEKMKHLVKSLPKENYSLLARAMQFFKLIIDNKSVTKMTPTNISISFGLNLLDLKVEDPIKLSLTMNWINKTCENLILHSSELFPEKISVSFDQSSSPVDESSSISNSEQIHTTEKSPPETVTPTEASSVTLPEQDKVEQKQKSDEDATETDDTTIGDDDEKSDKIQISQNSIAPLATSPIDETNNVAGDPHFKMQPQRASLRGWQEILDSSRNRFYYFEPVSKKVSWYHPRENPDLHHSANPAP